MAVITSELSDKHLKYLSTLLLSSDDKSAPEYLSAVKFVRDVRANLYEIKWYGSFTKDELGMSENEPCYVAWYKGCPMVVNLKPYVDWEYEDGRGKKLYLYSFAVDEILHGNSECVGGAIQSAALEAIEMDGDTSHLKSRWKNQTASDFFKSYSVDPERDNYVRFADFAGPAPTEQIEIDDPSTPAMK